MLRRKQINFHYLGLDNEFLDRTPKGQATKEKIDELDFITIKYVYVPKGIIKNV